MEVKEILVGYRLGMNYPTGNQVLDFLSNIGIDLTPFSPFVRNPTAENVAPILRMGDSMQISSNQEIGHSVLIDDAAERLGVSRRTVYYRIHEGRLKTIRTRCGSQRVLCASIEALLQERQAADDRRRGLARAARGRRSDTQAQTFQIEAFS